MPPDKRWVLFDFLANICILRSKEWTGQLLKWKHQNWWLSRKLAARRCLVFLLLSKSWFLEAFSFLHAASLLALIICCDRSLNANRYSETFPLRVSMTTVCLALCLLAFATHMPLCFWPSFSSQYKRRLTCVSVCKQGPCAFKHFYLCLPWPFIHVFAFGKVWFRSFSLPWQTHHINCINWSSSECLLNIGFMFHHFQLQCDANADFILGFIPIYVFGKQRSVLTLAVIKLE